MSASDRRARLAIAALSMSSIVQQAGSDKQHLVALLCFTPLDRLSHRPVFSHREAAMSSTFFFSPRS
jgi:hypothetical protein